MFKLLAKYKMRDKILFISTLLASVVLNAQSTLPETGASYLISPKIGASSSSWFGEDVEESHLALISFGFVMGAQLEYGKKKIKSITEIAFIQKGYRTELNLGYKYRATINYLDFNTGVRYYPVKGFSIKMAISSLFTVALNFISLFTLISMDNFILSSR